MCFTNHALIVYGQIQCLEGFLAVTVHCSVSFFLSRLMPIQQCDLVLVHIYPQGEDTLVSDRPKKEVRSYNPDKSLRVIQTIIYSDDDFNDDVIDY